MTVLKRLWSDQGGAVISIELVLVATVLVMGMIVGLTTLRNSVLNELADVAGAVDNVNQGYAYNGATGHGSAVAGSTFSDNLDYCDTANDASATLADQCVLQSIAGAVESGTAPTVGTP